MSPPPLPPEPWALHIPDSEAYSPQKAAGVFVDSRRARLAALGKRELESHDQHLKVNNGQVEHRYLFSSLDGVSILHTAVTLWDRDIRMCRSRVVDRRSVTRRARAI